MARYADFKSYIQDKYSDKLTTFIGEFINKKHDGIGFHSFNVLSVCDQKAENVVIKRMCCHDDIGPMIRMDIHCAADIVTLSLGKNKSEADRKTKWFTVYAHAILANGLKDFCIDKVEEYYPWKFEKEGALDEYLIPYIYSDQLEDEAEDFYEFYCSGAIFHEGWRFPIEYVFGEMGIEYYEAPLPQNVFGRMYFNPSMEEIYEYDSYMIQRLKGKKERHLVKKEIKAGTMLINEDNHFMKDVGSGLNTIAHEIIHWEKHQKFFEILALLNEDETNLSCAVEPEMSPENLEGVQKAIWWAEWQANVLAPRILMPKTVFIELFNQIYEEQSRTPYFQTGDIMERTLDKLGSCFGVSKYAAKTRAIQLGIDIAEGAYIFVDGQYYPPINFPLGTLGKNQTFVVDKDSAQRIIESNESLKLLIEADAIIYTGSVFCVNDSKYIKESSDPRLEYELTQYALEHADECCLIFTRKFSRDAASIEAELYSTFYLSKEVTASIYVEPHYDPKFEHNQSIEQLAVEMKQFLAARAKERAVKKELPDEFNETLKFHMNRKGVSIINLANRSNLSDTTIKKYRAGEVQPSIDNLMAIFIGLNLGKKYCDDMLDKAGYKLNDSDLHGVYQFLLCNHIDGTIDLWNDVLEASGFEKIPKK
ncbi:hypothetical protein [Clostridium folliculivorans]|uniref:hypothetical protein n=1 Tax=Clostridium folliculivorans TaxID=2886038 RepID=UPI0021C4995C|nr:hypothetical protein [Clostridium folliculivorans]GKU31479.1 hypothetical protein CFB3_35860 [Clostridium folliculivorans]